mmetsp:Transcript_30308/g.45081  ORF Transcript_30308/g.45081 Transcript_30308/m.45081 type:complete len:241 (+) Transcript_30308:675-1397(+)
MKSRRVGSPTQKCALATNLVRFFMSNNLSPSLQPYKAFHRFVRQNRLKVKRGTLCARMRVIQASAAWNLLRHVRSKIPRCAVAITSVIFFITARPSRTPQASKVRLTQSVTPTHSFLMMVRNNAGMFVNHQHVALVTMMYFLVLANLGIGVLNSQRAGYLIILTIMMALIVTQKHRLLFKKLAWTLLPMALFTAPMYVLLHTVALIIRKTVLIWDLINYAAVIMMHVESSIIMIKIPALL